MSYLHIRFTPSVMSLTHTLTLHLFPSHKFQEQIVIEMEFSFSNKAICDLITKADYLCFLLSIALHKQTNIRPGSLGGLFFARSLIILELKRGSLMKTKPDLNSFGYFCVIFQIILFLSCLNRHGTALISFSFIRARTPDQYFKWTFSFSHFYMKLEMKISQVLNEPKLPLTALRTRSIFNYADFRLQMLQ